MTSRLTPQELKKCKSIHRQMLSNRTHTMRDGDAVITRTVIEKNWISFKQKKRLNEKHCPLVCGLRAINEAGLRHRIDALGYTISYCSRTIDNYQYEINRTFPWYKDDFNSVDYACYVVVLYLRKDNTIHGGNVNFLKYGSDGEDDELKKLQVRSGSVLCFRGDIPHCLEPMLGYGRRDTIVVYFRRMPTPMPNGDLYLFHEILNDIKRDYVGPLSKNREKKLRLEAVNNICWNEDTYPPIEQVIRPSNVRTTKKKRKHRSTSSTSSESEITIHTNDTAIINITQI